MDNSKHCQPIITFPLSKAAYGVYRAKIETIRKFNSARSRDAPNSRPNLKIVHTMENMVAEEDLVDDIDIGEEIPAPLPAVVMPIILPNTSPEAKFWAIIGSLAKCNYAEIPINMRLEKLKDFVEKFGTIEDFNRFYKDIYDDLYIKYIDLFDIVGAEEENEREDIVAGCIMLGKQICNDLTQLANNYLLDGKLPNNPFHSDLKVLVKK